MKSSVVTMMTMLIVAMLAVSALAATTLEIWTGPNESEHELVRSIADAWNASRPDIQVNVTMTPVGSAPAEYMAVAIAGGEAPDMFTAFHAVEAYELARGGALLALSDMKDLDSVVAERTTKPLMTPDQLVSGKTYFIPWQMEIIRQEYNLELLSRIGIGSPPATYTEFMDFGRRLKNDNVYAMGLWHGTTWSARLADFYLYYLAASGGDTLFSDGKSTLSENATALQVAEFFKDLHDREFAPRDYSGMPGGDLFGAGVLATQRWGNGAIPYFRDNLPFEWGAGPIPVPDGYEGADPPFTYANIKVVNSFSSTKHPQEVWEFMRFFLSESSDQKLLATGRFPVRADLPSNPAFSDYFEQFPEAVPFAQNLANSRDVAIVPGIQEAMRVLAEEFIASVITGAKPISSAFLSADQQINRALQEAAAR